MDQANSRHRSGIGSVCTSNGPHLLAAVQRRWISCLAVTAVLLRVRQQQLSCGRAAAELRLHTARVAQLLESCARGTSAGKAGRCAACQARSVRAIDWQTSRVREQDRQKSWEGQEGDDQRARDERESAQRRCVVECRAAWGGLRVLPLLKMSQKDTSALPQWGAAPSTHAPSFPLGHLRKCEFTPQPLLALL